MREREREREREKKKGLQGAMVVCVEGNTDT